MKVVNMNKNQKYPIHISPVLVKETKGGFELLISVDMLEEDNNTVENKTKIINEIKAQIDWVHFFERKGQDIEVKKYAYCADILFLLHNLKYEDFKGRYRQFFDGGD